MNANLSMERIRNLPGMEEFKSFCTRLQIAARNKALHHLGPIPLPNLVFAAAPGSGVTMHIRLLTGLLKELQLLNFVGEEECFEWALGNENEDFDKFLRRVRQAGGFYGYFHGVIGLDISRMLKNKSRIPSMDRIREYMEARQGRILFILIVPDTLSEPLLQQLMARFASITPAELIHMPFPYDEVQHYVAQQLRRRGFTVTEEADALLSDSLSHFVRSPQFEGYQTLINLTEEILWRKISRQDMQDVIIDKKDLDFLFDPDGYFSRYDAGNTRHSKVGFHSAVEV